MDRGKDRGPSPTAKFWQRLSLAAAVGSFVSTAFLGAAYLTAGLLRPQPGLSAHALALPPAIGCLQAALVWLSLSAGPLAHLSVLPTGGAFGAAAGYVLWLALAPRAGLGAAALRQSCAARWSGSAESLASVMVGAATGAALAAAKVHLRSVRRGPAFGLRAGVFQRVWASAPGAFRSAASLGLLSALSAPFLAPGLAAGPLFGLSIAAGFPASCSGLGPVALLRVGGSAAASAAAAAAALLLGHEAAEAVVWLPLWEFGAKNILNFAVRAGGRRTCVEEAALAARGGGAGGAASARGGLLGDRMAGEGDAAEGPERRAERRGPGPHARTEGTPAGGGGALEGDAVPAASLADAMSPRGRSPWQRQLDRQAAAVSAWLRRAPGAAPGAALRWAEVLSARALRDAVLFRDGDDAGVTREAIVGDVGAEGAGGGVGASLLLCVDAFHLRVEGLAAADRAAGGTWASRQWQGALRALIRLCNGSAPLRWLLGQGGGPEDTVPAVLWALSNFPHGCEAREALLALECLAGLVAAAGRGRLRGKPSEVSAVAAFAPSVLCSSAALSIAGEKFAAFERRCGARGAARGRRGDGAMAGAVHAAEEAAGSVAAAYWELLVSREKGQAFAFPEEYARVVEGVVAGIGATPQ